MIIKPKMTFNLMHALQEMAINETAEGKMPGLLGFSDLKLEKTESGYIFSCSLSIDND